MDKHPSLPQFLEQLNHLSDQEKQQIRKAILMPPGLQGQDLLPFYGRIDPAEAKQMLQIIQEDCRSLEDA